MAAASEPARGRTGLDARDLLAVLGVLVVAGVLAVAVGPFGAVLVGVGLAAVRYFLPAPFAFALGQLVLVGLLPTGASTGQLVGAEAGLLVVLVGPAAFDGAPIRTVAATLIALAGLGAVGWGLLQWTDALWQVGLTLTGSTALVAYGLHRYERVRLGLVEGA